MNWTARPSNLAAALGRAASAVYLTAGFELAEADHASKTVLGYVIGIASTEAATITKLNRSGMDHEAWRAAVGRRPRHPGRRQTMGSPEAGPGHRVIFTSDPILADS